MKPLEGVLFLEDSVIGWYLQVLHHISAVSQFLQQQLCEKTPLL